MSCFQLRFPILFVAGLLAVSADRHVACADVVRYSWSGMLVPAGTDDPWGIGQSGVPFELDIAVPSNANDLLPVNIEFAEFNVEHASLSFGETETVFSENGTIHFSDNNTVDTDFVLFEAGFEHLGHTIEIGSAVVLPESTYRFLQLTEPPPVFGPTTEVVGRGACCGGTYTSVIPAGTVVTCVPEPASLLLLVVCATPFISIRNNPQMNNAR